MELILIGFMGSGKTTVSQLLGQKYHLPVLDLDAEIVAQTGQSIPEIFAAGGEARFRAIEHQVLAQVIDQPGILATGGGTPLREDNRALLKASNVPVVHLRATAAETKRRIGHDQNRPLAAQLDQAGLAKLKAARHAAYQACADFTIETNQLTPLEVAQAIEARLSLTVQP